MDLGFENNEKVRTYFYVYYLWAANSRDKGKLGWLSPLTQVSCPTKAALALTCTHPPVPVLVVLVLVLCTCPVLLHCSRVPVLVLLLLRLRLPTHSLTGRSTTSLRTTHPPWKEPAEPT